MLLYKKAVVGRIPRVQRHWKPLFLTVSSFVGYCYMMNMACSGKRIHPLKLFLLLTLFNHPNELFIRYQINSFTALTVPNIRNLELEYVSYLFKLNLTWI